MTGTEADHPLSPKKPRPARRPASPPPVAAAGNQAERVLAAIRAELPGLLAVAAVEVASGRCLASFGRLRPAVVAVVAGHHAATVRLEQQALHAWPGRTEQLTDLLVPLRRQFHLLRVARHAEWFVYLAVRADDITLALAREVLRSVMKRAGC